MMMVWMPCLTFSQTAGDSVVISRNAQRMCVKCLQNAPLKDSIIVEQQHRIEIKDSIIAIQGSAIQKAEETVQSLDGKLSECKVENVDLIRKKKNGWKIGVPIGGVAGGILGWILGRNIK